MCVCVCVCVSVSVSVSVCVCVCVCVLCCVIEATSVSKVPAGCKDVCLEFQSQQAVRSGYF